MLLSRLSLNGSVVFMELKLRVFLAASTVGGIGVPRHGELMGLPAWAQRRFILSVPGIFRGVRCAVSGISV